LVAFVLCDRVAAAAAGSLLAGEDRTDAEPARERLVAQTHLPCRGRPTRSLVAFTQRDHRPGRVALERIVHDVSQSYVPGASDRPPDRRWLHCLALATPMSHEERQGLIPR
jgi:hypothetical protein